MNIYRVALTVVLLVLSVPGWAAEAAPVYERGGANPAATACATCHGPAGEGVAAAGFPRLAGLSAGYLRKQLGDFAAGRRAHPLMQPIASALTDEEIAAVTDFLAARPQPSIDRVGRAAPAEGVGEVLALRGAWSRNIPACVTCHGPGGSGVGDSFPAIGGQSAQYLSAQLLAWQQKTRQNDPSDLMGHIARSLTADEVQAVSTYFASLTGTGAAQ